MHLKRWVTALVLLPAVIYCIGFSPSYFFYTFLCLFLFLGLREFFKIVNLSFVFQLYGYCISALLISVFLKGILYFFPLLFSLALLLPMSYILLVYSPKKEIIQDIGLVLLSIVYITVPVFMLMVIYKHPMGKAFIFLLLSMVIAGDTAAFYFGRYLGRHKLHEKVSPNKTWEGAIGGFLCSLMIGVMFIRAFRIIPLSWDSLCLLICIPVAAQLGDLAESFIKRSYNVKDSGTILPGHGGVLDRVDSFLFTVPLIYGYMIGR